MRAPSSIARLGPIQEPGEAVTRKTNFREDCCEALRLRPHRRCGLGIRARGGAAIPAAPNVLGGQRGPSLFEIAERIAGDTLERISADLGDCTRCKLHRQRHKIVFGVGNPRAESSSSSAKGRDRTKTCKASRSLAAPANFSRR